MSAQSWCYQMKGAHSQFHPLRLDPLTSVHLSHPSLLMDRVHLAYAPSRFASTRTLLTPDILSVFLALFLLMHLCGQAQRFGRPNIWKEPIQELGWFGEWPGYYNTHSPGAPGMPGSQQYFPGQQYPQSGYPGQQYPQGYPQSGYPQGSYSNMQHSHSGGRAITIQHQPNGGAPVVTTTPI